MDFKVQGLECGHCVAAIEKAVAKFDPTAVVEVEIESGTVRISGLITETQARQAIGDAGYQAELIGAAAKAERCCGCCA